MAPYLVEPGTAHPLGVSITPDGVNVSMFSQFATGVEMLLFETPRATTPLQIIRLDPARHKTFHLWHVFLRGCPTGLFYAFRVHGPDDPASGCRFNPGKLLISPYARGICRDLFVRADATGRDDNLATSMRCAIVSSGAYDWEGDRPLNRPIHESILYEVHVAGFTRSPSSGVGRPGTFAGMIERIPHLVALGITAVELLPVFEFDDTTPTIAPDGTPLRNYWGYGPIGFFSPHSGYCVARDGVSHGDEFRDLVKALHRANIEVILDVVFNHTDEGNEHGPTHSFRGIDNPT